MTLPVSSFKLVQELRGIVSSGTSPSDRLVELLEALAVLPGAKFGTDGIHSEQGRKILAYRLDKPLPVQGEFILGPSVPTRLAAVLKGEEKGQAKRVCQTPAQEVFPFNTDLPFVDFPRDLTSWHPHCEDWVLPKLGKCLPLLMAAPERVEPKRKCDHVASREFAQQFARILLDHWSKRDLYGARLGGAEEGIWYQRIVEELEPRLCALERVDRWHLDVYEFRRAIESDERLGWFLTTPLELAVNLFQGVLSNYARWGRHQQEILLRDLGEGFALVLRPAIYEEGCRVNLALVYQKPHWRGEIYDEKPVTLMKLGGWRRPHGFAIEYLQGGLQLKRREIVDAQGIRRNLFRFAVDYFRVLSLQETLLRETIRYCRAEDPRGIIYFRQAWYQRGLFSFISCPDDNSRVLKDHVGWVSQESLAALVNRRRIQWQVDAEDTKSVRDALRGFLLGREEQMLADPDNVALHMMRRSFEEGDLLVRFSEKLASYDEVARKVGFLTPTTETSWLVLPPETNSDTPDTPFSWGG